jgi:hypothetical protein
MTLLETAAVMYSVPEGAIVAWLILGSVALGGNLLLFVVRLWQFLDASKDGP